MQVNVCRIYCMKVKHYLKKWLAKFGFLLSKRQGYSFEESGLKDMLIKTPGQIRGVKDLYPGLRKYHLEIYCSITKHPQELNTCL